ncbi:MAG TPA: helix-turn-helix domain-containing protein [Candidatus Dormibacteraeota bacterium]|jgi:DNA-binding transcriptional ArsR family regulator|nr:helix-turn-helix domain-containing protein [Candidatus Dormibacteraeota bacterium]
MNPFELVLHPVRLRIVHAMSGGRTRTTSDLCASLPDVPRTTLYRHVGLLAEAGVLEVVGEQRVHGAVERRYRLRRERSVIDADQAASMSLEDHRRGFAAAMAALLAEFNAYLDREHADPLADSVSYRQGPLWLNQQELAELIGEIRGAILSRWDNRPAPDRRPYLLSTILFPIEAPPQHGGEAPTPAGGAAPSGPGRGARRDARPSSGPGRARREPRSNPSAPEPFPDG